MNQRFQRALHLVVSELEGAPPIIGDVTREEQSGQVVEGLGELVLGRKIVDMHDVGLSPARSRPRGPTVPSQEQSTS